MNDQPSKTPDNLVPNNETVQPITQETKPNEVKNKPEANKSASARKPLNNAPTLFRHPKSDILGEGLMSSDDSEYSSSSASEPESSDSDDDSVNGNKKSPTLERRRFDGLSKKNRPW